MCTSGLSAIAVKAVRKKASKASPARCRLISVITGLLLAVLTVSAAADCQVRPITGMVWQLDNATVEPDGTWERLGATQLLTQWSAVGNLAYIPDSGLPTYEKLPDWDRIASEPWASEVIMGLAGYFGEQDARTHFDILTEQSLRIISAAPESLNIVGWYFPVEVDPTWSSAPELVPYLNRLPRPLWISLYDNTNLGADHLTDWLQTWLPADVGILFQDGVGLYVRTPEVARQHVDVLASRLGQERVRVIAEAFRPLFGGGFRPATVDELEPQIKAYAGHQIYLFDGPHYVSNTLVEGLVQRWCPPPPTKPSKPGKSAAPGKR